MKKRIAWNKGLKGYQIPWNKGLTRETDDRVNKYTISRINHIKEDPFIMKKIIEKRKITLKNHPEIIINNNRKHSATLQNNEELRKRIGQFHKNKIVSSETRKKISEIVKLRYKEKGISDETRKKYCLNNSRYWLGKKRNFPKVVEEMRRKKISSNLQGIKMEEWKAFKKEEFYSLSFNNAFKKAIKLRDNKCMLCNMTLFDLNLNKKKVNVHHINYDKQLTIKENCITLCNSCHSLTNFNRENWISFFQNILMEKYNYKFEDTKPVLEVINEI